MLNQNMRTSRPGGLLVLKILVPKAFPVLDEILNTGIYRGHHDHRRDDPANQRIGGERHQHTQSNHRAGGLDLATPAGSNHTIISAQAGTWPHSQNMVRAAMVSSLSARGSRNLPKSLT